MYIAFHYRAMRAIYSYSRIIFILGQDQTAIITEIKSPGPKNAFTSNGHNGQIATNKKPGMAYSGLLVGGPI